MSFMGEPVHVVTADDIETYLSHQRGILSGSFMLNIAAKILPCETSQPSFPLPLQNILDKRIVNDHEQDAFLGTISIQKGPLSLLNLIHYF